MHFDSLKSVFFLPLKSTGEQRALKVSRDIFWAHWSTFWSVSRLYFHNPKGLEQTQNFQEAKEGSRTISVGLESDITLLRLETWMSDFSGLKCLSYSFLSVCGSVLVLILQEAAETHTRLNKQVIEGIKLEER